MFCTWLPTAVPIETRRTLAPTLLHIYTPTVTGSQHVSIFQQMTQSSRWSARVLFISGAQIWHRQRSMISHHLCLSCQLLHSWLQRSGKPVHVSLAYACMYSGLLHALSCMLPAGIETIDGTCHIFPAIQRPCIFA